jgi:hypothetical protein
MKKTPPLLKLKKIILNYHEEHLIKQDVRIKTKTRIQSIEPSSSIPSGQSVKFQCYVCKDLLNDQPIDKRKFWKVCKDCDNWICGTCEAAIQFEFDSERVESDEFYCQQCFICK